MTLKIRFTIIFVVVIGTLTSTYSFLVYRQVASRLHTQAEENLSNFLNHEVEHWRTNAAHRVKAKSPDLYLAVEKNGTFIFGHSAPSEPQTLKKAVTVESNGDTYRFTGTFSMRQVASYLSTLKAFLLMSGAIVLLLTGPIAYAAATLLLMPFRVLAVATGAFSADNLSRRLAVPKQIDEYGLLAHSFNDLFERLESSFEEVQRYAQNVSHEFRTPLSVISAQAENALRKELAPEIRTVFEKIAAQSHRLDTMATHLLALGDIRRWAIDTKAIVPVDVLSISKDLASSIQRKSWAAGKDFSACALGSQMTSTFKLNEQILITVVSNLLENAFYFARSRVTLGLDFADGYLEVAVEDDGPGIAPEDKYKVFEPFYTRRTGGHGLGLTIVKAALDATQGKFRIQNSADAGLCARALFRVQN